MHFKSVSYKSYLPKMKCIDEDMAIYGDFNANIAASLMVVFEKCDPEKRQCADKTTIDEWMKFKYIITVENEENYLQTNPVGERRQQFSRFKWHGLSSEQRLEKVKLVTLVDI